MKLKRGATTTWSPEYGDNFWYAVNNGDDIAPALMLSAKDAKAVQAAIDLLDEYEQLVMTLTESTRE